MFQRVREGRSLLTGKTLASIVCVAALLIGGARNAQAETVITGTIFGQEYLLTGSPINVSTNAVLKITFTVTTSGENLELCAGSAQDFEARRCTTPLNDSGGPGFVFLTLVDAASLNGKHIYILKLVGSSPASFRFTIE